MPGWSHPDPPAYNAALASGGGGAKIVAKNLPAGVTQAMVDQGQELFGQVCTACHSAGGVGSTVAPPLTRAPATTSSAGSTSAGTSICGCASSSEHRLG